MKLAITFLAAEPSQERVAPVGNGPAARRPLAAAKPGNPNRPGMRPGAVPKSRDPLKEWEEYAHALLQANEASFIN